QTEFQPPQAIWLISIDFDGCFLLVFQNIQFICEVNGPLKPLPPQVPTPATFMARQSKWSDGYWEENPPGNPEPFRTTSTVTLHVNWDTNSTSSALSIFTDGSKMNNKVGAAFCVLEPEQVNEFLYRLVNHNSVFQDELTALHQALPVEKEPQTRGPHLHRQSQLPKSHPETQAEEQPG
ncbi:hypothetical protein AVEN_33632-1, partial [Araneus ventricosus]